MSNTQVESVEDRSAYQRKVLDLLRKRAKNLNSGGVLMGGVGMGGCCPCGQLMGSGPAKTKRVDGKWICK